MDPSLGCASDYKIKKMEDYVYERLSAGIYTPFIFITESWLKPCITKKQAQIFGYNCYRSDRIYRERGGAALYIHKQFPVTNVKIHDDGTNEIVACTIPNIKVIPICLYKPPDSSSESFSEALYFLSSYLDSIEDCISYNILLLGDFNFPEISWKDKKAPTESGKNLLRLLEKYFLSQMVSEPTRENSILDLVITNNSNLIAHISIENSGISDHSSELYTSPIIQFSTSKYLLE